MSLSDPPRGKRKKTDLLHLHALPSSEPKTQTGWVVWVWPEIQAALNTGKRLHEVWEALQKDGMEIPYEQFRVYVSRIRKREIGKSPLHSRPVTERDSVEALLARSDSTASRTSAPAQKNSASTDDPLSNIREQRAKRRSGFDYDPFPANKKLI